MTGKEPWEHCEDIEILFALAMGKQLSLESINDGLLAQTVQRCWAWEPDNRPSFSQIHAKLLETQPKAAASRSTATSRTPTPDEGWGCGYVGCLLTCIISTYHGFARGERKQRNIQTVYDAPRDHLTLRGVMHDFRVDVRSQSGKGLKENLLFADKSDIVKSPSEEAVRHMCQALVPLFRKYDLNRDNQISMEEFCMILNDLGEGNISAEQQQSFVQAADMDGSGSISFEEFVASIMALAAGMPEKVAGQILSSGSRTQCSEF